MTGDKFRSSTLGTEAHDCSHSQPLSPDSASPVNGFQTRATIDKKENIASATII
jgi:hypothetical protein